MALLKGTTTAPSAYKKKPVVVAPKPVAPAPKPVVKPVVKPAPAPTNYNGFATAEDYARAIQDKVKAGQALSDPTSAQKFIQSNPGLFGQGFSLNANPSTVFTAQPGSEGVWSRDYLTKAGVPEQQIGYNAQTKQVMVNNQPVADATQFTGGKSYATAEDLAAGLQRLGITTNKKDDLTGIDPGMFGAEDDLGKDPDKDLGKDPDYDPLKSLYEPVTYTPPKESIIPQMSFAEALAMARGSYDPLWQRSRTNAASVNQQQQELLRQALNARGQLRGGLAQEGAVDLSGQLQDTLAGLDATYNTQLNEGALAIQDKTWDRGLQEQDLAAKLWEMQQGANSDRINNLLTYTNQQETGRHNVATENLTQQQIDQDARQWTAKLGYDYDSLNAQQKQWARENAQKDKQISNDYTLGKGRLAVDQGQLAVSRGNLGVSQAQLGLSRQKFAADQAQGQATPSKGEAYDSAYSTLDSQIAKGTAAEWLIKNRAALVDTLGIAEYNQMVQYARDGG